MKIIVFLADGFEEIEAFTVVDYLRRMDIEVETISIKDDYNVIGAHKIQVLADGRVSDIKDLDDYDGLVIPGGMPGASNLRDDKRVIDIVEKIYKEEKLVAAICAGPIVLEKAGIIKGKRVTSYPGFEEQLKDGNYTEDIVAIDRNLITSRGPYLATDFTIEIIRYLLGEDKVEELKKDILYHLK